MPGNMVEEADTSDSGAGAKKPPIYGVEVDQGKLLYSAGQHTGQITVSCLYCSFMQCKVCPVA